MRLVFDWWNNGLSWTIKKQIKSSFTQKQSPREVCAHPSPKIKTCRRIFSKLLNIIGMVHQNLLNDVRAVHACEVWIIYVNSVVYGTTIELFFKIYGDSKHDFFNTHSGVIVSNTFFQWLRLTPSHKAVFSCKKGIDHLISLFVVFGTARTGESFLLASLWWLRFTRCQIWQTKKHTLHTRRC